jgi:hypothetical protein
MVRCGCAEDRIYWCFFVNTINVQVSMICRKFLDQLSDYQLAKEDVV